MVAKRPHRVPRGQTVPFMLAERPLGPMLYPLCSSNGLLGSRCTLLWSLNALLGSRCTLYARQTASPRTSWPDCTLYARQTASPCTSWPDCTLYARQTACWAHAVPFMLVKRSLGLTLYPSWSLNASWAHAVPFMVAKRPLGLTLYPLCSPNGLIVYLVARLYPLWSINALLGSHCALYARQTACWAHAVAFMLVKRPHCVPRGQTVPFMLAKRPVGLTL